MSEQARDATEFIKKPNKMEKALFAVNAHENRPRYCLIGRCCATRLVPGADPIHAMRLKILADSVETGGDASKALPAPSADHGHQGTRWTWR